MPILIGHSLFTLLPLIPEFKSVWPHHSAVVLLILNTYSACHAKGSLASVMMLMLGLLSPSLQQLSGVILISMEFFFWLSSLINFGKLLFNCWLLVVKWKRLSHACSGVELSWNLSWSAVPFFTSYCYYFNIYYTWKIYYYFLSLYFSFTFFT